MIFGPVQAMAQSRRLIAHDVEAVKVEVGTNSCFLLQSSGTLTRFDASQPELGLSQVDTSVQAFAIAPNGDVYDLEQCGNLYVNHNMSGAAQVDTSVQAFAIAPNGDVYDLEQCGNLYVNHNMSGAAQVDSLVSIFSIAPDGTIYDLRSDGTLATWVGPDLPWASLTHTCRHSRSRRMARSTI